eukprot:10666912-Lingulodinium_polyedra.AAC.1
MDSPWIRSHFGSSHSSSRPFCSRFCSQCGQELILSLPAFLSGAARGWHVVEGFRLALQRVP